MNFYILNVDESTVEYIRDIKIAVSEGDIELGKIHLCSTDNEDFGEGVIVHNVDGTDFLADYLLNIPKLGIISDDQLIPSHSAPHVIAMVIVKLMEKKGLCWQKRDFGIRVGTPYEVDLENGVKAVSFATEKCVDNCVEPDVCPIKNVDLSWDVGKTLREYAGKIPGAHFIGFECSPFLRSVATIPMREVARGYLRVKNIVLKNKSSRLMIATHSKCHGIVALIEVEKLD